MKKAVILIVFALLAIYALNNPDVLQGPASTAPPLSDVGSRLAQAWEQRRSNVQVSGEGGVSRLLSDDNDGSRHQRFILTLESGHTVLVAHNIDLAPRLSSLEVGDKVAFYGVYEWNNRGGVVHWTHHDPQGQHVAGWLKHRGRTYQ